MKKIVDFFGMNKKNGLDTNTSVHNYIYYMPKLDDDTKFYRVTLLLRRCYSGIHC